MEVNLGCFKYSLMHETAVGISTVSMKTLQQSKLKVCYALFLILTFGVESILYCRSFMKMETKETISSVMIRVLLVTISVHSLLSGIFDYKTKISVCMNLEAIERKLEAQGTKVPGKGLVKVVLVCFTTLTVVLQVVDIVNNLTGLTNVSLTFTKYLTTPQNIGTLMSLFSALSLYHMKVLMIQKAITKTYGEINQDQLERSSSRHSPETRQRRQGRTGNEQSEADMKWTVLAELQRSLEWTEVQINESAKVQVLLNRMVIEVLMPILFIDKYFQEQLSITNLFNATHSVGFFIAVCTVEWIRMEKEKAFHQLSACRRHSSRQRHQLLANIHRGRRPFSVIFFDMDYSLLFAILENLVFTATARIAAWKTQ